MALTKTPIELSSTPSIVDGGNATAITIDSSENVGIGASPATQLFVKSASNAANVFAIESADALQRLQFGVNTSNGGSYIFEQKAQALRFGTSDTERMRIDASGNLLVGHSGTADSVVDNGGQGVSIRPTDVLIGSTGACLYLNREDSDGILAVFRKDGTNVGSIGTTGGNLQFMSGSVGVGVGDDNLYPTNGAGNSTDAALDIGDSGARFRNIYRSGSTISTSDRNMKQDIRDLTDAERNVAVAAKGLLKAFRFIDRVEKEGDSANIHFGIIAQDLAAAFTAEGLDANDYQVYRADTFTDDDGNEQTRLGICYENLLAFIISAI